MITHVKVVKSSSHICKENILTLKQPPDAGRFIWGEEAWTNDGGPVRLIQYGRQGADVSPFPDVQLYYAWNGLLIFNLTTVGMYVMDK